MMTFSEIIEAPAHMSRQALIKAIHDDLAELAVKDKLDLNEMALLAAAAGIIRAFGWHIEREEGKPAAAGQPDNLTSLDV